MPNNNRKELTRDQIISNLKIGKVIKLKLHFANSQDDVFKRIIILSSLDKKQNIYYVLTTTKIKKFIENKYVEITGNFLFIKKGEENINPDNDIVIDIRTVYPVNLKKLLELAEIQELEFLDDISISLLNKIKSKIRFSPLINDEIKNKLSKTTP